jgi:hypothetical protein
LAGFLPLKFEVNEKRNYGKMKKGQKGPFCEVVWDGGLGVKFGRYFFSGKEKKTRTNVAAPNA